MRGSRFCHRRSGSTMRRSVVRSGCPGGVQLAFEDLDVGGDRVAGDVGVLEEVGDLEGHGRERRQVLHVRVGHAVHRGRVWVDRDAGIDHPLAQDGLAAGQQPGDGDAEQARVGGRAVGPFGVDDAQRAAQVGERVPARFRIGGHSGCSGRVCALWRLLRCRGSLRATASGRRTRSGSGSDDASSSVLRGPGRRSAERPPGRRRRARRRVRAAARR